MPLGERIKALRTEAGLSQAELAEQVGGDGRQISRYENGRITPSLDALARIAEALNVSLDHLVFDDIARRPLHAPENILGDRLAAIAELNDDDRSSLLNVIDGLVTKSRVRTLAGGVS
jgi:transcriptional regulator with XRE-family HTH domain